MVYDNRIKAKGKKHSAQQRTQAETKETVQRMWPIIKREVKEKEQSSRPKVYIKAFQTSKRLD